MFNLNAFLLYLQYSTLQFGWGGGGELHVLRGGGHQFAHLIELGIVLITYQIKDNTLTGSYHTASLTQAGQSQVPILVQTRAAAIGHDVDINVLFAQIYSSLLHTNVRLVGE